MLIELVLILSSVFVLLDLRKGDNYYVCLGLLSIALSLHMISHDKDKEYVIEKFTKVSDKAAEFTKVPLSTVIENENYISNDPYFRAYSSDDFNDRIFRSSYVKDWNKVWAGYNGPPAPTRATSGSTPYSHNKLGISDPRKLYIRWPLINQIL